MTTRTIAGQEVEFDEQGFMANPNQWNKEIAAALAQEIGLEQLTAGHWQVIEFCRQDFQAQGESPTLRRITTAAGVPTKELYTLFPKGPAKLAAKVAGIPKPRGCI